MWKIFSQMIESTRQINRRDLFISRQNSSEHQTIWMITVNVIELIFNLFFEISTCFVRLDNENFVSKSNDRSNAIFRVTLKNLSSRFDELRTSFLCSKVARESYRFWNFREFIEFWCNYSNCTDNRIGWMTFMGCLGKKFSTSCW